LSKLRPGCGRVSSRNRLPNGGVVRVVSDQHDAEPAITAGANDTSCTITACFTPERGRLVKDEAPWRRSHRAGRWGGGGDHALALAADKRAHRRLIHVTQVDAHLGQRPAWMTSRPCGRSDPETARRPSSARAEEGGRSCATPNPLGTTAAPGTTWRYAVQASRGDDNAPNRLDQEIAGVVRCTHGQGS